MPSYYEEVHSSYETSVDDQVLIAQSVSHLRDKQLPKSPDRDEILRIHNKNISTLQKPSKPSTAHQLILPSAYRPSTASLEGLQQILLRDLQLEAHHRGRFITGKTITSPYVSTETVTIIEEDGGAVAMVVLCYQSGLSSDSAPPKGSTIIVKEPYCKCSSTDGDYVIRVDHPSDIAILRGDDPTIPMIMEFVTGRMRISALEWKDAGDKAYLEKKYLAAIESYTQALDAVSYTDPVISRDLYRKRAHTNLITKQFQSAKQDALASCPDGFPDFKTCCCIARASYEVGEYKESGIYYEKASNLSPNDLRIKKDHQRALCRLSEQETGEYNFPSMVSSVCVGQIHLDHADFTSKTIVAPSPHHGRGLFATKFIAAGSLVLCEKAFCLPDRYGEGQESDVILYNLNTTARTERPAQAALFLQLVPKVSNNPDLAKRLFDLDSGSYVRCGKEGDLVDGVPIIDSFLIESIRLKNCFSSPRLTQNLLKNNVPAEEAALSTGLWTHAAYINHSCVPNCARSFIGDMMILRATCDITSGTELTHQYMAPDPSYTARQESFRANWDFECACLLCSGEKKSPENMHLQRTELVDKIKADVFKWPSLSRVPRATVRYVERLTRQLEELYEPAIYKDIPRLFLVHPTIWLVEAYRALKNPSKTVKYAFEVLRNFGLFRAASEERLQIDYSRGITNRECLVALLYAAEAYQALGKVELARECEREARGMFVVLSGSNEEVEKMWSVVFG